MKKPQAKSVLLILALIILTGAAMAYTGRIKPGGPPAPPSLPVVSSESGLLHLSGRLVQTHVLKGSPGTVGLELALTAARPSADDAAVGRGVDLVVVLDRSGSMQGAKLEHARQSLQQLLSALTDRDRFALLSYSDAVQGHGGLLPANAVNLGRMHSAVNAVGAGGATNLGEGLRAGIDLISSAGSPGRPGRVILISDGLANRGVTDPVTLGRMAAAAAGKEFAVSTVGVGADFNEFLMTQIAEHGAGAYYYLENPAAFAEVFQREFRAAQSVSVTGIAVQVDLPAGVRLVDASGYPVTVNRGAALFYPGSLRPGQTRQLFLTFQIPTDQEKSIDLGRITARYAHNGTLHEAVLEDPLTVACSDDRARVLSSIDRTRWGRKVVNDDYNRLKQEVAADISAGSREQALKRIDAYESERRELNSVVRSPEVGLNLEKDLGELKQRVDETFQGAPAAVMEKQKSGAKSLQYEGYSNRRSR
jgi:Ca-activated chloride channel family protein